MSSESNIPPWLLYGGLGVFGVAAFLGRKQLALFGGRIIAPGQEGAFASSIPSEARPYAAIFQQVAAEQKLDPFLLVALAMKESRCGQALTPPGPGGTGDFGARSWAATPLPEDGGGWGRGIMQIDLASNSGWLNTHDWTDPYTNITKGASILRGKLSFLSGRSSAKPITDGKTVTLSASQASKRGVAAGQYPDPRPLTGELLGRAVIAAYNTGEGNVLMSVACGKDPDVTTTRANYASAALSMLDSIASTFNRLVS